MIYFSYLVRPILLILSINLLLAEKLAPVTLSAKAGSNPRAGEVVNLSIHMELDEGWHVWGVYNVPKGPISSPVSTTIETTDEKVSKSGKVREPVPIVKFDEGFEIDIPYHEKTLDFILPVLLKNDLNIGNAELMVSVQYQTCNDRLCLLPKTVDLMVPLFIESGSARSDKISFSEISADGGHQPNSRVQAP